MQEELYARLASTEEVVRHQAIRYAIFGKEYGYLNQECCPNELDDDGYDDDSFHVWCFDGSEEKIAGLCRFTLPTERELYTEIFCELPDLEVPRENWAELNRYGVMPAYRNLASTSQIRKLLMAAAYPELIKRNKKLVISGVHARFYTLMTRQHTPIATIATTPRAVPGYYEGYFSKNPDPVIAVKWTITDVGTYSGILKQ